MSGAKARSPAVILGCLSASVGLGGGCLTAIAGRPEFSCLAIGYAFGMIAAFIAYEVTRS